MDKTNLGHHPGMQIIDKLPAVIFEYTVFPDGKRDFTYISLRCQEVLGLNREALLKGVFPLRHFIYSQDWDGFLQSSENSIATLNEWRWEGRIHHRDEIKWINAVGVPTRMDDGRVAWSGIITDITQSKEVDRRREAETGYRNLLEELPLGVCIQKNGKLIYVNNYALKMMAAGNPADLIGKPVVDFVHPDDKQVAIAQVKKVLAGESAPMMEEKYVRLDGKIINVEVLSQPITYEGEPAVQLIIKDITDRKEAEESIRNAETLFSQVFQNSPMAIVMLNDRGTVVKINEGFREMFGYSPEELSGKELNQFIVPEGLESEGNDLNTLVTSNRVIRLETNRIRKDGSHLSVIIYGVPVHLDETTIGIFGVYVDITERKKVEEELKIRNTELDNFAYKVSQDLRAPWSSILGLVNPANLPGDDDNLKDDVPLVGQKVLQLDHFISDVLSQSKNLKLDVKPDFVDLKKIIKQAFTELNYLKGNDEIRKDVCVEGEDFYSDPWRIAEIFHNLISNAIKYRKLDHPSPMIEIETFSTKQAMEISFKDNGIGIDEKDLEHIFEMFYRASEQSEGSGLGLYIVKNAVDKLGGVVMVNSQLDQGTSFKIVLPNLGQKN